MNISEVVNMIEEGKSANNIFRNGLIYNMKRIDARTSATFYHNTYQSENIYHFTDDQMSSFRKFSIQYTCYVLSNYPLRGMSATVKDCSINQINTAMFHKDNNNDYKNQTLFKNIAVDAYYRLGIKEFVTNLTEFESVLLNPIFYQSHIKGHADALCQLIFLLNELSADAANRVTEKWNQYQSGIDWKRYLTYNWIGTFMNEFSNGGSVYKAFYDDIKEACEKSRSETKKISGGSYAGGYPVTYEDTRTYTYYGEDVGKWLKDTAKQNGFYSGKEPAYMGTGAPSSGCVKKGTKILMADGSQKNIEEIQYHDEVRNCHDMVSYCSKELVQNPLVRQLYSVNEDVPFMSMEHPILTQRGWCSLDPVLSMKINPAFEVSVLKKGDVFMRAFSENGSVKYSPVTVRQINIETFPENVMCYDLDFYDGYKSYYANGYPCLCNYPHITTESVKEALKSMDLETRNAAIGMLTENSAVIEMLIGTEAWNVLHYELESNRDEMDR